MHLTEASLFKVHLCHSDMNIANRS